MLHLKGVSFSSQSFHVNPKGVLVLILLASSQTRTHPRKLPSQMLYAFIRFRQAADIAWLAMRLYDQREPSNSYFYRLGAVLNLTFERQGDALHKQSRDGAPHPVWSQSQTSPGGEAPLSGSSESSEIYRYHSVSFRECTRLALDLAASFRIPSMNISTTAAAPPSEALPSTGAVLGA